MPLIESMIEDDKTKKSMAFKGASMILKAPDHLSAHFVMYRCIAVKTIQPCWLLSCFDSKGTSKGSPTVSKTSDPIKMLILTFLK